MANASGVEATNRYRNGGRRTASAVKSHVTCTNTTSNVRMVMGVNEAGVDAATCWGTPILITPFSRSTCTAVPGWTTLSAPSSCSASSTACVPVDANSRARRDTDRAGFVPPASPEHPMPN